MTGTVIKFYLQISQAQMDELDSQFYEFGIDDEIWWENQNTTIVTENPLVVKDIEKLLEDIGIEYTKE